MWNDIGHKLQSLAKVICWLGVIGSLIWAIVLWSQNSRNQPTILLGILYLVLGSFISWISSWALYGLGLVVEHVENNGTISYTDSSAGYALHGTTTSDGGVLTSGSYWTCPECKTRNPMSKVECKECGKIR